MECSVFGMWCFATRSGSESSMNVDVTTWRTTPKVWLSARPSATLVPVNGGVRRIDLWDVGRRASRPGCPADRPGGPAPLMIPNRCLSVQRHAAPCSFQTWRDRDLPPPRAQGMCEGAPTPAPAEMGRSTDADGDGNVRKNPSHKSLNFTLDSDRFIDATAESAGSCLAFRRCGMGKDRLPGSSGLSA